MNPSLNTGGSYRKQNKFYLSLADESGTLLYRFMYRPLTTAPEQSTVDMELRCGDGTLIGSAAARKLVPYGAGPVSPTGPHFYRNKTGFFHIYALHFIYK